MIHRNFIYFLLSLLGLTLLSACSNPQRAGSQYNPEEFNKLIAEFKKRPVDKSGSIVNSYHSALGTYCHQYEKTTNDQAHLVCSDGKQETSVRLLK